MKPTIVKCDERGRIYLEKGIREQYGQSFIVVKAQDELVLMPTHKDPLKHLQELGKKLPKRSIKNLKKEIKKQAVKDITKG